MTIALPTLPQTLVPQQRQPSTAFPGSQTDSENTQASAFADLLASLLTPGEETRLTPNFLPSSHGGLTEDQSRHAAALAPLPGSPAEAFSAARLLVDMALDLPNKRVAGLAETDIPGREETSATPPVTTISGPDNALAEGHPSASVAPDLHGAQPPRSQPEQPAHLSRPSGSTAARELSSANMGRAMPAGLGTALAHRLSAPLPELPQSRDIQRATREPLVATPSGRTSPFGAQLVMAETGLQLILRLPKLAESDRTALETTLAHLLEGHGHRRTAIIIHEVTKG